MLKRNITYTDFEGNEITETFYFNLSRTEMVEMEVSYEGGLEATIQRIIETQDSKALIMEFKRIVLLSYGIRSADGKRFIKNDEVREEFTQTAAYDALFMELAMNDDAAVKFIQGILPRDLAQAAANTPDISKVPVPPTNETQQLDPQAANRPSPSSIGWTPPSTTE
jgi:hypothetical protein